MTDWFRTHGEGGRPVRIFCFPYAGGDPRSYLDWQAHLGDCADLVAVCPPGKAHRADEPAPTFDDLVDQLAAAIAAEADRDPRPVQLFGHSFGGLLAFEVARRLRDVPAVGHLTASGISAPSLLPSARVRELARLDGAEFAEALAFFGQFPPEVVGDQDVLDLLLPGLKADFELAVGYRYRPAPPLRIGVSIIVGTEDPHVGDRQVAPWDKECVEPPEHRRAVGGHFYFDPDPEPVVSLLRAHAEAAMHVEVI